MGVYACSAGGPPLLGDDDASMKMLYGGSSSCGSNAQSFVLPTPPAGIQGIPFGQLTGSAPCASSSGTFDYTVVDMNGDERADLVVTSACDDATISPDAILVYLNTGSAFGPATRYSLPSLPTSTNCVESAFIDVDGDLKPDFVVTSLCTDATVGTTQWLVYHNTGTGFDLSGQSYTLPANAALHTFASLEVDTTNCQVGQVAYAFYDITGDAIPDVVITTACNDTSVGVTHWLVYPGTATGVTSSIAFTLPGNSAFATPLSGEIACVPNGFSASTYTVVDFNGDLKPDLVVTQSCTDLNAGSAHWSVYPNSGAAFALTPTLVPLPSLNEQPGGVFDVVTGSTSCANVTWTLNHTLVDFDGDLKPDIVVTQTCGDPEVGADYWLVMRNTGTSFGATEVYQLPPPLDATEANRASALTGALACSAGRTSPAFAVTPLLSPALDVVITTSCSDPTVGNSRWLLFVPNCP